MNSVSSINTLKLVLKVFLFSVVLLLSTNQKLIAQSNPKFEILVLTERGGQHGSFTDRALAWLNQTGNEEGFLITEINNTDKINQEYLSKFKVFIQLDYPPYNWTDVAKLAFEDYIENGKGGWIGFHHAGLLGEFDGFKMWNWFSDFLGGIRFKNYIAKTTSATIYLEDSKHPIMKNINPHFVIPNDEFYTFDKSPRAKVSVLANVDESSYEPSSDIKMGDHPVIWSNQKMKSRNVYFLFGHSGSIFASKDFTGMFKNAIHWAAYR